MAPRNTKYGKVIVLSFRSIYVPIIYKKLIVPMHINTYVMTMQYSSLTVHTAHYVHVGMHKEY